MESGLEDRNNVLSEVCPFVKEEVSMESGLEDRNNMDATVSGIQHVDPSQWSPA